MTMPMSGKKLYRIPERGVVKGVCAGLAEYMGVPVALVRVMAVLSIFAACLSSQPFCTWCWR